MDRKWLVTGIAFVLVVLVALGMIFSKRKESKNPTDLKAPLKSPQELSQEALSFKKEHEWLKAKEIYGTLMTHYPDYEDMEAVQKNLEEVNLRMIFSNSPSPQTVVYEVQNGDTLGKIAKKFSTTVDLIKKKNNLTSDIIQTGRKLYVWMGTFHIFVDKSQNILILKDREDVVKVYDVATGANNVTPVGTFKITSKLVDPVWFKAGAIIPPESPQNILGSRWLGFDLPGYGIHGTVEPDQMRAQVTAGCIRMRNEDVEELYSLIPIGTTVVVKD